MCNILDYTNTFADVTAQTLVDMFGIETSAREGITEESSVQTTRSFIVSLYYTGSVYGEYLLALDEETAAKIIGWEEPITDENRGEVREEVCDALSETLNTIVGESIVHLQEAYPKLTLTAPRIFFGEIRYPQFKTGRTILNTEAGEIECHFCLDLMRLDLATSYDEAMQNMVEINEQLKEANRHLAEQQAQLVHSERMASVGILASGVAHEINNPLFFVEANLSTLKDYVEIIESTIGRYDSFCDSLKGANGTWVKELEAVIEERDDHDLDFVMEDTKQLVVETRDGCERIKGIVQGLKDFSQAENVGAVETDINSIAKNSCNLIGGALPEGCTLEMDLSEIPKLICNAGEIGQVLTSVLRNATQAVGDEGKIVVSTAFRDSEIVISVKDNGEGIPEDHLEKIFEPFYTTKAEGEGTGLGLSIAYGIVRRHNGALTVSSPPGQGTQVKITLPTVKTAVSA